MNNQIGFIAKIAIASLLLSVLIKYGGQSLPLIPTNTIALIVVLLPSLVLTLVFGIRYRKLNS